MRVLFLEAAQIFDDLLPAGLRQVGCDVRMLTEVVNGEIDRLLTEFEPDFALTLGWSWFPTPDRLDIIRETLTRHGIPLVYWSTEDPCWHEEYCVPYVQRVQPDLVVTICNEHVDRYEALGFRAACLPFGYNPAIYQPVEPGPEYACDIAIVANFYTTEFHRMNRKRSLQQLVTPLMDQGYDVKIWGNSWDRAPEFGVPVPEGAWRGYLPHREAPIAYNSAKIVIGLQNEFDFETNLTMRTCEVLGAGGFLLTSRTRAVEAFFEHKQHLVMSNSPEETRELVAYYLAHPEERAQIAAAGEALVSTQHTYGHRALDLLQILTVAGIGRALRDHTGCSSVRLPPGPYSPCPPCDSSSSGSPEGPSSSSPCESVPSDSSGGESFSSPCESTLSDSSGSSSSSIPCHSVPSDSSSSDSSGSSSSSSSSSSDSSSSDSSSSDSLSSDSSSSSSSSSDSSSSDCSCDCRIDSSDGSESDS
jgi:spore maturation protein CgeB